MEDGEEEKGEEEDKMKMQFETLRHFCSSVLSRFNASTPSNVSQTELVANSG